MVKKNWKKGVKVIEIESHECSSDVRWMLLQYGVLEKTFRRQMFFENLNFILVIMEERKESNNDHII